MKHSPFVALALLTACTAVSKPATVQPTTSYITADTQVVLASSGTKVIAKTLPLDMQSGPVPGVPGYSIAFKANKHYCHGQQLVVNIDASAASLESAMLAHVMRLTAPTGLSFDPDQPARTKRDMERFQNFVTTMKDRGQRTVAHYTAIASDSKQSMAARLAAGTRVLQTRHFLATLLAHVELPSSIEKGEFADEKISAFCDTMDEVAEPMIRQAQSDAETLAGLNGPSGWWTPVFIETNSL